MRSESHRSIRSRRRSIDVLDSRSGLSSRPHISAGCLVLVGVNTPYRRALLALTVIIGLYVGVWAQFFPHVFYESFPGFGMRWISVHGAENEHLIRDVGSLYLALTAISIAGFVSRTAVIGQIAGLGWAVFGVLHFAYHLNHLVGSAVDVIGTVVSLATSAILGILLLFPSHRALSTSDRVSLNENGQ